MVYVSARYMGSVMDVEVRGQPLEVVPFLPTMKSGDQTQVLSLMW